MNVWEFASGSPWLAFFLALLACMAVETVCGCVLKAVGRYFRHRNVASCGWPPPHLDADGDFLKPDPEA